MSGRQRGEMPWGCEVLRDIFLGIYANPVDNPLVGS